MRETKSWICFVCSYSNLTMDICGKYEKHKYIEIEKEPWSDVKTKRKERERERDAGNFFHLIIDQNYNKKKKKKRNDNCLNKCMMMNLPMPISKNCWSLLNWGYIKEKLIVNKDFWISYVFFDHQMLVHRMLILDPELY